MKTSIHGNVHSVYVPPVIPGQAAGRVIRNMVFWISVFAGNDRIFEILHTYLIKKDI